MYNFLKFETLKSLLGDLLFLGLILFVSHAVYENQVVKPLEVELRNAQIEAAEVIDCVQQVSLLNRVRGNYDACRVVITD